MKKKSMPYGVYHLLTCVLAVVMAVLAVLVSQRAESASFGVSDGDDTVFGFFFADCVFQLLFQHAES